MEYTAINSKTWDEWADHGCPWSVPVSHEQFLQTKETGEVNIFLTPCRPVPSAWLGEVRGKRILGLASGGGQQMPLLTAAGACCTVFDYSERQLDSERLVARREGYEICIVKGDMTNPLPFRDDSFDLIVHPVSNCYIEKVEPVFLECFRVLKRGGALLSGLDNGLNFLFDDDGTFPLTVKNKLPFHPLSMPPLEFQRMADSGEGIQFSHTLEEQIGGQLKAGFRLIELYEDRDREGDGLLREYAPQYFATRCVKP